MNGGVRAYVGLGSNLGDPRAAVLAAMDALAGLPHSRLVARSRLYRSPAWGPVAQPDYVNAAAALETTLGARELLDALLRMELQAGRDRAASPQWGPRTLDLDLLLHGDARIDVPGLHLPHPRLHERAFVVVPLAEIAPTLQVPGQGPIADLVAAMATADIQALG